MSFLWTQVRCGVVSGAPSIARSSSPSITSMSSSRRVTRSSRSRFSSRMRRASGVRVGHDALDLGIDQARRVFGVGTAFGSERDVEERLRLWPS